MYESPITMYTSDIQEQIEKQQEEQLMLFVNQSIGYDVDKLELIKALQYDREQYTKGFRDCKSDMLIKVKQARVEIEQNAYPIVHGVNNHDMGMTLDGIFQVLDKLIAESEG